MKILHDAVISKQPPPNTPRQIPATELISVITEQLRRTVHALSIMKCGLANVTSPRVTVLEPAAICNPPTPPHATQNVFAAVSIVVAPVKLPPRTTF